ncbi:MAG: zinc finger domain-containing protein, partial [Thermotogota bacterium]
DSTVPKKDQLLIGFEDGSYLSAVVQMYGGLWCFPSGSFDNPYYLSAKSKPFALSDAFNQQYFEELIDNPDMQKMPAKGFLATEQRIPGLGNGVLQDILFRAGLHPKRKIGTLTKEEKSLLYKILKTTLKEMAEFGGRDTERDLFGACGGYQTQMSKNTAGKPCPRCGETIAKEAYMGGSVYYCPNCQKIPA